MARTRGVAGALGTALVDEPATHVVAGGVLAVALWLLLVASAQVPAVRAVIGPAPSDDWWRREGAAEEETRIAASAESVRDDWMREATTAATLLAPVVEGRLMPDHDDETTGTTRDPATRAPTLAGGAGTATLAAPIVASSSSVPAGGQPSALGVAPGAGSVTGSVVQRAPDAFAPVVSQPIVTATPWPSTNAPPPIATPVVVPAVPVVVPPPAPPAQPLPVPAVGTPPAPTAAPAPPTRASPPAPRPPPTARPPPAPTPAPPPASGPGKSKNGPPGPTGNPNHGRAPPGKGR